MSFRYQGPSDFFSYGDKFYKPGQVVPISKAEAEHMMRYSTHRFEGINQEDVPQAEPVTAAPQPIGDDGTPIKDATIFGGEVKPITAPPSPVAAGQMSGASDKKD